MEPTDASTAVAESPASLPLVDLMSELPPELRGQYKGLLLVELDGELPVYRQLLGREAAVVDLDRLQKALFAAGIAQYDSNRLTILKDYLGAGDETDFGTALERAHTTVEQHRGTVSPALNDSLWRMVDNETLAVNTVGSGRLREYWGKSPTLKQEDNAMHPFILFIPLEKEVQVKVVRKTRELLDFPQKIRVMAQWPQESSAEWYTFEIRDLMNFMRSRGLSDDKLGTPEFIDRDTK